MLLSTTASSPWRWAPGDKFSLRPEEFTPTLPSPLEGEGLPCGERFNTPQGKGGGDAFA